MSKKNMTSQGIPAKKPPFGAGTPKPVRTPFVFFYKSGETTE